MKIGNNANIFGLTGGVATGKSMVSRMLAGHGAVVVDADQIARSVVRQGMPARQMIVSHFGGGILLPGGELDRALLGKIVFSDPEERIALENIVHPFVFGEMEKRARLYLKQKPKPVIILDIPLLFETKNPQELAKIILVDAPVNVQLTRLMARDGMSQKTAWMRIRSQMPMQEKKKRSTWVIDNGTDLTRTRVQVDELWIELSRKNRWFGKK